MRTEAASRCQIVPMTDEPVRPVVVAADTPERIAETRILFEEYASSLGIDLGFQGFADELAGLPGAYVPPRGGLWLAFAGARAAGCVAVRPLSGDVCEMKRLYVRPDARVSGLGRTLASVAIAFARSAGYRAMRLDTLPSMAAAQALYRSLGFSDIPPYRHNPVPGTTYMELVLPADSP